MASTDELVIALDRLIAKLDDQNEILAVIAKTLTNISKTLNNKPPD